MFNFFDPYLHKRKFKLNIKIYNLFIFIQINYKLNKIHYDQTCVRERYKSYNSNWK